MANNSPNERPIVIRRVKKVVGGGHHGGAWKVAYADFVTAMMAFFMLLWLISSPDKEKLKGLAEYFTPGPPSAPMANGNTSGPNSVAGSGGYTMRDHSDSRSGGGRPTIMAATAGVARGGSADIPNAALRVLADELKVALDANPQNATQSGVTTDVGQDQLRISLTDTDRQSMFQGTGASLNAFGRNRLATLAKKLAPVAVNIAIEGHTDGQGGADSNANWQLSGARALAARNALIAGGIPADRFTQLVALAGTRPVYPDQPTRPENRRITIVLLADRAALPDSSHFAF